MTRKNILKRIASGFVSAAIAMTSLPIIPIFAETGTNSYSFDGYNVEYSVKNEWSDGQAIEVKITNTGDEPILNWAFKYNAQGEISDLWNASVYDAKETSYVIKNAGWNYEIAPEASISFGYTLSDYSGTNPEQFELCAKRVNKTDGYDVQYNITNEWDTGLQGEIVITNTSEEPLEAWELSFDSTFAINNLWDGRIISSEENHYVISSEMWSNPIAAGESKTIGFTASKIDNTENLVKNYRISVIETIVAEDAIITDKTGTFLAIGDFDEETNSIILMWRGVSDSTEYNIYEKSGVKKLVDTVLYTNTYSYTLPLDSNLEKYVFAIETILEDGKISVSNDVVMTALDDGTYELSNIDTDNDGIDNILENLLGTNPSNKDTDGDRISDGYEYYTLTTNPLEKDSDENGIIDSDEDFDGDGLTNYQEYERGTNPFSPDTDDDGFTDKYEISKNMNPLLYDVINLDLIDILDVNDNTIYEIEELNYNEDYPLLIDYNGDGSQVVSISGVFSEQIVESPADAFKAICSVKTLIGLKHPKEELKLDSVYFTKSGASYMFSQWCNNIRIMGSTIFVSVDKHGKTLSLKSSIASEELIKKSELTAPRISDNDVKSIINVSDALIELVLYRESLLSNLKYA